MSTPELEHDTVRGTVTVCRFESTNSANARSSRPCRSGRRRRRRRRTAPLADTAATLVGSGRCLAGGRCGADDGAGEEINDREGQRGDESLPSLSRWGGRGGGGARGEVGGAEVVHSARTNGASVIGSTFSAHIHLRRHRSCPASRWFGGQNPHPQLDIPPIIQHAAWLLPSTRPPA